MAALSDMVVDNVAKHHHVHPGQERFERIGDLGSHVFWVTFIIFAVTFVLFTVMTFQRKVGERANAYCSTLIVGLAAAAYYSMATGVGSTWRSTDHPHTFREVFFARYIDWAFTTPLLLVDLLLLSGVALGDLLWIVVADMAMIWTGLAAALVVPGRWGWFIAGCVFMLAVMVGLVFHGRRSALARGREVGRLYSGLMVFLLVLWWLYPVVFLFAEGTDRISVDKEALFYAVLDVLAKVVFGAWIMASHNVILAANGNSAILEAPLLGGHREGGLLDDSLDPA